MVGGVRGVEAEPEFGPVQGQDWPVVGPGAGCDDPRPRPGRVRRHLMEVAGMMRSLLMAFLPVCDEHGDLHGIMALRDLHRVLRPGHPTTAQSILAGRGTAGDDRGERPRRPRLGPGGRATDVAAAGAGRAPSGRRHPVHRPGQPPKPHPPGTPLAPHAHRTVTRSRRPRRGGRRVNLVSGTFVRRKQQGPHRSRRTERCASPLCTTPDVVANTRSGE